MQNEQFKCPHAECAEKGPFKSTMGLKRHMFLAHTPKGRKALKNAQSMRWKGKKFKKSQAIVRVERKDPAIEMNEMMQAVPLVLRCCWRCQAPLVGANMGAYSEMMALQQEKNNGHI
jgi:hypothetical protein